MGRITIVGKTSLPACRKKPTIIRKTDYGDTDPVQTPPTAACAFTQNLGVVRTSCSVCMKKWALPQEAILAHRPQPEEADALPAGHAKHALKCSEVTADLASACVGSKSTPVCARSIMLTSLIWQKKPQPLSTEICCVPQIINLGEESLNQKNQELPTVWVQPSAYHLLQCVQHCVCKTLHPAGKKIKNRDRVSVNIFP